ncbi:MAG TPA: hypothetical protein VFX65_10195 [Candidatus Limnocylindrales bacterium]|nr:hypothetical protein [Candidatus Limnocylindrales bacterium]
MSARRRPQRGGPRAGAWPAGSPGGSPSGVAPSGDPFQGVERVYIDGNNLLYALSRGSAPGPAAAVIGRIRAAFPPGVTIDLVFDGPPSGGIRGRLATGLRVAYSGRRSADQVIEEGVAAQLDADGPAGTWGLLVVSDDRGLQAAARALGARTAGAEWLAGRLGRLGVEGPPADRQVRGRGQAVPLPKAGTTIGHRRSPRPPTPDRD